MLERRAACFFVAFVAALSASRAAADVDVEVPPALAAKGTLLPAGEVEIYRFFATKGTLVNATATSGRGANLTFVARFFDPSGDELVVPAANVKATAKRLSITKLPLTSTGLWRLELSAAGTGEYALSLSAKAQAKWAETRNVAGVGQSEFEFSAPPGSRVTLSAKAAKGSGATPRFGKLFGGTPFVDLSTMKSILPTGHVVTIPSIQGTGDFDVEVDNPGAAGDVSVSVTVRPPRTRPLKLDVRAAVRGHAAGGESVLARSVGPTGGTVEITDGESELAGVKVQIPPGAFAAPTTITIASAPTPKTAAENQASGPAVFLGPSGTTFAAPVDVVLPYDPALVPVDFSPQDLTVLVVESNGASAVLTPKAVDENARTVTVGASGFSVCIPQARRGQQPLGVRPGGDEFWFLGMNATLFPDGNDDSRGRQFALSFGECTFLAGGVFEISASRREVSFGNQTSIDGSHLDGNLQVVIEADDQQGTWSYGADGQTISLLVGGGPTTLLTSSDGNHVLARGEATGEEVELDLMVRKNPTPITAATLAGKYHVMFWNVAADDRGFNGAIATTARLVGTWTFAADGTFSVVGTQRGSDLVGSQLFTDYETIQASGTYVIDGAGDVIATIPADAEDDAVVFRFHCGPGAAVILGADHESTQTSELEALVLIRQGAGMNNAVATGEYRGMEIDFEADLYAAPTTPNSIVVLDHEVVSQELALTFSGAGALSVASSRHTVRRETSVGGGVLVEDTAEPAFGVRSRIDAVGRLTVTVTGDPSAPVGAITPDGVFGFAVANPAANEPSNVVVAFVKPPPKKTP
jgi:hypothetical protein